MPDFSLEDQYEGIVCGIDEVGRGPLAGPVVAACVHIPSRVRAMEFISGIKDSKKLSEKRLDHLYDLITEHCDYGAAQIESEEIDEINILQATMKAMRLSCQSMGGAQYALIDGNRVPPDMPCPAQAVVKGDDISTSIAAASIIAKVTRDRIMRDLAQQYPGYGWESNVGYPAPVHLEALKTLGVTPHHRRSFAPVRRCLDTQNQQTAVSMVVQKRAASS